MIVGHLCAILEPTTDTHAYWEANPVLTQALDKSEVSVGLWQTEKYSLEDGSEFEKRNSPSYP